MDVLKCGRGYIGEDVVGEAHYVKGKRQEDARARREKVRGVEWEGFMARFGAGVHQRRHRRIAAEPFDGAWDFRRPGMERRFAAGDCHDSGRAQRDRPYLEAQLAGQQWEEVEGGAFFHIGRRQQTRRLPPKSDSNMHDEAVGN